MQKRDAKRVGIFVGIILLIPLLGDIFVEGWNWGIGDFIIMGALLFGTGMAVTFAAKNITNPVYRVLVCALIILALIALWAELAVDAVSQGLDVIF